MNKLLIFVLLATLFTFSAASTALCERVESDINVVVNGEKVIFPDQKPLVIDGVTYVPFRAYAEKLGASVEWDSENEVIIITNSGIQNSEFDYQYGRYYLKIGVPQLVFVAYSSQDDRVKSVEIFDMPQAPIATENGRTMLPFRVIGEFLGALVWYDSSTHSAKVLYEPDNKLESIYPAPVLSTVTQEYFRAELEQFRIDNCLEGVAPEPDPSTIGWYNQTLVKNRIFLKVSTNDELMAAATWKAIDLEKWYDHQNSDGTKTGLQFIALYMKEKYPYGPPYHMFECISATLCLPPFGMDLIEMTPEERERNEWTDNRGIYYLLDDVEGYLDASEYWYNYLLNDWGINLVPLTETSDLELNGVSYSKYKMSSTAKAPNSDKTYKEHSGKALHAFSIIRYWNEDMYRTIARDEVQGWGHSAKGHRYAILTPGPYMISGFGIRMMRRPGGDSTFGGASLLLGSKMADFQLEAQKKNYLEQHPEAQ